MNTKIAATLYLYSKSQILISLICTLVYFAICFIFIVKIPRNNKKKTEKNTKSTLLNINRFIKGKNEIVVSRI